MKKVSDRRKKQYAKVIQFEVCTGMNPISPGILPAKHAADQWTDTLFVRETDDGWLEFAEGTREYGPRGDGARRNGWRELGWVVEDDDGFCFFECENGTTLEFAGDPSMHELSLKDALHIVDYGIDAVEMLTMHR